jgi:phosphoglycerate dehydrogenase-like enzyme
MGAKVAVVSEQAMGPDDERPVVVAIMYPREWYGDPDAFEGELDALRALDPRVQIELAGYVESSTTRQSRAAGAPIDVPELTAEQRDVLSRAEVVTALDLPGDLATLAPNLRWVQAVGAGTEQLHPAVREAGVVLTNNGGANALGIAEFAFGRLLEAWKQYPTLADLQREHRWEARFGRQVAGSTLGLIGFGAINQAVAARAVAFGMRVLVLRRHADAPVPDGIEGVYAQDALHDMLARCDGLIAAAPETPSTVGMLDAAALAAMKPGAFLCNVGRGSLVDEPALIDALRTGQLSSAALDVTSVEPLPADDPLWDAPNLRLSYHCSSDPTSMFPNVHRVLHENLRRYLAGEPLLHQVALDG